MKIFFNTILFLVLLFIFENNAYSLYDNEIKEICQRKKRRTFCIKDLKFKKRNLLKGNQIEIPVIHFKKNTY